jgi:hypothetical protein
MQEVIELLSSFRDIMRRNFETMDVEKIQERWCCGDEPWLFRERWEKLFEDFCDVKQEKFDPSRVQSLVDVAVAFTDLRCNRYLSFTIRSNTVLCTTVLSYLLFSARPEKRIRMPEIASSTSCTAVPKLCLT